MMSLELNSAIRPMTKACYVPDFCHEPGDQAVQQVAVDSRIGEGPKSVWKYLPRATTGWAIKTSKTPFRSLAASTPANWAASSPLAS